MFESKPPNTLLPLREELISTLWVCSISKNKENKQNTQKDVLFVSHAHRKKNCIFSDCLWFLHSTTSCFNDSTNDTFIKESTLYKESRSAVYLKYLSWTPVTPAHSFLTEFGYTPISTERNICIYPVGSNTGFVCKI